MIDTLGVPLQLVDILLGSLPLLLLFAGTALIVAEALAPGANFIVVGVALFLTGGIGVLASGTALAFLASPIGLTVMFVLFAVLTFYGYSQFDIYGGEGSGTTTDSDSLRGQSGRVTETVTATSGEVKLENGGFNPYYSARSIDGGEIEEGTEVIVVDPGGGNVVKVQSVEGSSYDEIDRELARGTSGPSSPPADPGSTGETSAEREEEKEKEKEPE